MAAGPKRPRETASEAFGLLKRIRPVHVLQSQANSFMNIRFKLLGPILVQQEGVEYFNAGKGRETHHFRIVRQKGLDRFSIQIMQVETQQQTGVGYKSHS